MRTPLEIPTYLVTQSKLYAPDRDACDAVCHLLEQYPQMVADLRTLRRRFSQLDNEGAAFDASLAALQDACRAVLEL